MKPPKKIDGTRVEVLPSLIYAEFLYLVPKDEDDDRSWEMSLETGVIEQLTDEKGIQCQPSTKSR
tara:strand:+ start:304 stop:498 length:195 start_codon:yes stop_codon:yes gene_type:complete